MGLRELATYSFACNVGPLDRAVRLIVGVMLVVVAAVVLDGLGLRLAVGIGGAAVALTGAVSRCGIYYLFGTSTRPHGT